MSTFEVIYLMIASNTLLLALLSLVVDIIKLSKEKEEKNTKK